MSLMNMKVGNKFIAVASALILFIYGGLVAVTLGIIPSGWAILTPLGASLFTITGSIVLLLETYFEGTKPNLKKDTGALINTIFASMMIVYGVILLIGQPAITGVWAGLLTAGYIITFILLGKELIVD